MKFLAQYKQIKNNYRSLSSVEKFITWVRFKTTPINKLIELVPFCGKLLDLGCGFGVFSYFFAFKYPDLTVVGLDLSQDRIRLAEDVLLKPKNLKFYLGRAEDLTEDAFSSILLTDVIYLLSKEELIDALNLCYKKAKEGGVLIIKTMNKNRFFRHLLTIFIPLLIKWIIFFSRIFPKRVRKSIVKISGSRKKTPRFYHVEELKHMLEDTGWRIVSIYDLPLWYPPWYPNIIYFCRKV